MNPATVEVIRGLPGVEDIDGDENRLEEVSSSVVAALEAKGIASPTGAAGETADVVKRTKDGRQGYTFYLDESTEGFQSEDGKLRIADAVLALKTVVADLNLEPAAYWDRGAGVVGFSLFEPSSDGEKILREVQAFGGSGLSRMIIDEPEVEEDVLDDVQWEDEENELLDAEEPEDA